MTHGVYIASGDRYVEESVYFAHSLRAHSPTLRRGGAPDAMMPRVLHWHGLNSPQWWHRFSPKSRQYKF